MIEFAVSLAYELHNGKSNNLIILKNLINLINFLTNDSFGLYFHQHIGADKSFNFHHRAAWLD